MRWLKRRGQLANQKALAVCGGSSLGTRGAWAKRKDGLLVAKRALMGVHMVQRSRKWFRRRQLGLLPFDLGFLLAWLGMILYNGTCEHPVFRGSFLTVAHSLFTFSSQVTTQSHRYGASNKLCQATEDNDLCVTQCRQSRCQGEWHRHPI